VSPGSRRRACANQVRIIGGRLRGRQLRFADLPGLRPTGDRIRETLFNWLQGRLYGRRCLDLFAGSGALGFETASRGAAEVVLLERDPAVVRGLRETARELGLVEVQIIQGDALRWLEAPARPFDVVFLDPPFGAGLLGRCLQRLASDGWLSADAWVYLEADASAGLPPLPAGWTLEREKRAGQVLYGLVRPRPIRDGG
jgi:16S rRNA (guanine966-N2)-methyltransferase